MFRKHGSTGGQKRGSVHACKVQANSQFEHHEEDDTLHVFGSAPEHGVQDAPNRVHQGMSRQPGHTNRLANNRNLQRGTKDAFAAHVYVRKAFDHVDRAAALRAMEEMNVKRHSQNLMAQPWSQRTFRVRRGSASSKMVKLQRGQRPKGCMIFAMVLGVAKNDGGLALAGLSGPMESAGSPQSTQTT